MPLKAKVLLPFMLYSLFASNPVHAEDEPVAMITTFEGKVSFENTTDREIDFGTDIYLGDMLKTASKANVSITFYNGCRQEIVAPESIVQVGANQSYIREGEFLLVDKIECEIPSAVLNAGDSHLKAGLVVRGYKADEKHSFKNKATAATDKAFMAPQFVTNNQFKIKLWSNKGTQPRYQTGEKVVIHFVSEYDAFIIMDYYTSDGKLYHITPDLQLTDGKVKAGGLYSIGQKGLSLTASTPSGTDVLKIIASNKPFDMEFSSQKQVYIQQINENLKQHKTDETTLLSEVNLSINIQENK